MTIRLRTLRWLLILAMCGVPFVPCLAQIAISGSLTYEFFGELGQHYSGSFEIANPSDAYVEVSVTQSDYLFFSDGSNQYADVGTVVRSNANWITVFLPDNLILAPGETMDIPFAVNVPSDPSLVGTYWSVFLVSPVLPLPTETDGMSIRQLVRYAVQLVTHIGDGGDRSIEIFDARVEDTAAGRTLEVDVENTGERWVRPASWIEVYDSGGSLISRVDGYAKRIYPGTSVCYSFDLPDLQSGTYKVLVVFDNALEDANIWGVQIDLSF